MNDRERFINCILGKPVDRPPYCLFWGPWGTTIQRWKQEGMPDEDFRAPFDTDAIPHIVPVNYGPCPKRECQVLKETEKAIVFIDSWGIKRRNLKKNESMSQFLEFPVKNRKDWERYKSEYLNPHHPDRLAGNWRQLGREWMKNEAPIQMGSFPDVGIFGGLRWLLGDEECLMAFIIDPALVANIMEHLTTLYLTVFEAVVKEIRVDMIHIWEDMCGRQGPLISPRHWEAFMAPCYRRIHEFAREHDIPLISVDTDGKPDAIVPPMMETGVNYLFPCEVAAGCDVNKMQTRFPGLGLMGGIDKRALASGPEAIDHELERIRPAVQHGRYIPDLDHLVPDNVSWENFQYFAFALKRLVGKE